MSDPKYNKYKGTVRFDDDNIVDIDLQPDTENITVLLNGEEVTGGSGLPEVTSEDNGDVLTVVSGEWTNAAPASQLPAVSGSDNGNVLTVVEGSWSKAAPASQLPAVSGSDNGNVLTVVEGSWTKAAPAGGGLFVITITTSGIGPGATYSSDKTLAEITEAYNAGKTLVAKLDNGLDDVSFYQLFGYTYSGDSITSFEFSRVSAGGDGFMYTCFSIAASGVSIVEYTT